MLFASKRWMLVTALSFDAMEHYFQLHGREWERYAWIKARELASIRHPLKKEFARSTFSEGNQTIRLPKASGLWRCSLFMICSA
ncbi:MAG: hypothetical protein ACNYPI_08085 [Arenicellales bacterium WSBS_2016_MAG_OTU3]